VEQRWQRAHAVWLLWGSVNHRDNLRLWIDHNQAKNVARWTCQAQRRQCWRRTCCEESLFGWRDSPYASGCPWGRGRGQEAPRQVRGRDASGRTALMIAAQGSHKEVVEAFLEHEKGMRDNQNHNALYYALNSGHIEVAKIIIPHEDPTDENDVTALMRAAARGDAEMVKLLAPLQKGAKDKDGNTALVHALKNRHEGIASFLIECEARSLQRSAWCKVI
ncbi:Ankyrin repeat protein, partial [Giardia duodenalis]